MVPRNTFKNLRMLQTLNLELIKLKIMLDKEFKKRLVRRLGAKLSSYNLIYAIYAW